MWKAKPKLSNRWVDFLKTSTNRTRTTKNLAVLKLVTLGNHYHLEKPIKPKNHLHAKSKLRNHWVDFLKTKTNRCRTTINLAVLKLVTLDNHYHIEKPIKPKNHLHAKSKLRNRWVDFLKTKTSRCRTTKNLAVLKLVTLGNHYHLEKPIKQKTTSMPSPNSGTTGSIFLKQKPIDAEQRKT